MGNIGLIQKVNHEKGCKDAQKHVTNNNEF
jgi:hypothetical protein